jgi:hypothetical protein
MCNVHDALPFSIPKQLLELSNSIGKLIIYHDMCALPNSLHPKPSRSGNFKIASLYQKGPKH